MQQGNELNRLFFSFSAKIWRHEATVLGQLRRGRSSITYSFFKGQTTFNSSPSEICMVFNEVESNLLFRLLNWWMASTVEELQNEQTNPETKVNLKNNWTLRSCAYNLLLLGLCSVELELNSTLRNSTLIKRKRNRGDDYKVELLRCSRLSSFVFANHSEPNRSSDKSKWPDHSKPLEVWGTRRQWVRRLLLRHLPKNIQRRTGANEAAKRQLMSLFCKKRNMR